MSAAARPSDHGDSGEAFLPDVARHEGRLADDGESYAETFIANATSAEDVALEASDEVVVDELGGPFVEDEAPLPSPLDDVSSADDDATDDDTSVI